MFNQRSIVFVFLFGLVGSVFAQEFQRGMDASQSGDWETALKEWKALAAQGDSTAQRHLGVMYESGEGVPQDVEQAVMWQREAAEQIHLLAALNLGVTYYYGEGVTAEMVAAFTWFSLAASNGNKQAADNREIIAEEMINQQISKAQKLARECRKKGYRGC